MSAWNPIWDDIFRSREWGKYPKEELVRFIARYYYPAPDRTAVSILDLGCGYGAATWYLAREGFSVYGIDGSSVVIGRLHERLASERLRATLVVGDVLKLPYPPGKFDCVVDIACLMCNGPDDSRRILAGVLDRLKPGGRLFSVTPSPSCWGAGLGEPVAECTFQNVAAGPFAGSGIVRFSSKTQLIDLYDGFAELSIDLSNYTVGTGAHTISHWIIDGRKG